MANSGRVRPWAKSRRKVAVLILAGAVAMAGVWQLTTYCSRRVLREIKALNGMANTSWSIPVGVVGKRFEFGPIDQVYLLGPLTDDGKLSVLDDVPNLRILTLTNTRVSDEGLATLARFRGLNCLYFGNIDHTKLIGKAGEKLATRPMAGGMGLAALKDLPNLQVVQLYGPGTTDDDIRGLVQLKHLVLLDLMKTGITPQGAAELKKALPKCTVRLR